MQTTKHEWQSINILKVLFGRLKKLIVKTGDPSVASYVRTAILMREKWDRDMLLREGEENGL